ncbi:hypothetical protein QBC44DRAFT_313808 [Cladorrhinum sp. PSN332]|nr:hypothetical protein QBC44DRAFT_313808 [Cladorrhinum sp. PSN332]
MATYNYQAHGSTTNANMRRRKPINYVAAIAVSCLTIPVTLTDSLCLPGGIILPVGTVLPAGAMLPDKFVKHFNMAAQNGMGVALGGPARLLEPDTVMADQSNSSESSESSDSDCSESDSESDEDDIRRTIVDAVEAKLRATRYNFRDGKTLHGHWSCKVAIQNRHLVLKALGKKDRGQNGWDMGSLQFESRFGKVGFRAGRPLMNHAICGMVFFGWSEPKKVLSIRGTFAFTLAKNKKGARMHKVSKALGSY